MSNCGMCQRSVTSYDYIPLEVYGDMCYCNQKEKLVSVDGAVCEYYVPSVKEKSDEN